MNDSDRSYMNDVQLSTIWHTYVLEKDKNIDLDLTISSRIYEELKKARNSSLVHLLSLH